VSVVDCGRVEAGVKGTDGPVSVDSKGDVTVGGDPEDLGKSMTDILSGDAKWKCKLQAKVAGTICRQVW